MSVYFNISLLRNIFFIATTVRLFDVHVTVHRVKFLIIRPTRCTNFSILFLEWNSACFRQFPCPSSGDFHCIHSNGICHTGLLTACWTGELSETCRVSFQE